MTDADAMVREAEEQIESWLVELDGLWNGLIADARREADEILLIARADAAAVVADAHTQAARVTSEADRRAETIVARADTDARALLANAGRLAAVELAEAHAEVARVRALATESSLTAQALALAAQAAASGRVKHDDLAALGESVQRLRAELSRVVDAAFDAMPAVEATAAALGLTTGVEPEQPAEAEPEPEPALMLSTVRRGLRQLFSRA